MPASTEGRRCKIVTLRLGFAFRDDPLSVSDSSELFSSLEPSASRFSGSEILNCLFFHLTSNAVFISCYSLLFTFTAFGRPHMIVAYIKNKNNILPIYKYK